MAKSKVPVVQFEPTRAVRGFLSRLVKTELYGATEHQVAKRIVYDFITALARSGELERMEASAREARETYDEASEKKDEEEETPDD